MDSLNPFLAALFGWALLDEELQLQALEAYFGRLADEQSLGCSPAA